MAVSMVAMLGLSTLLLEALNILVIVRAYYDYPPNPSLITKAHKQASAIGFRV